MLWPQHVTLHAFNTHAGIGISPSSPVKSSHNTQHNTTQAALHALTKTCRALTSAPASAWSYTHTSVAAGYLAPTFCLYAASASRTACCAALNCCSTPLRAAAASSRAADTCTAAAKHNRNSQAAVQPKSHLSTHLQDVPADAAIAAAHGARAEQNKGYLRPSTCFPTTPPAHASL